MVPTAPTDSNNPPQSYTYVCAASTSAQQPLQNSLLGACMAALPRVTALDQALLLVDTCARCAGARIVPHSGLTVNEIEVDNTWGVLLSALQQYLLSVVTVLSGHTVHLAPVQSHCRHTTVTLQAHLILITHPTHLHTTLLQ
jgi:hypothetical protein